MSIFYMVCYYLFQNNETVPRLCCNASFKLDAEGKNITQWNYGIQQPSNETLSAYDSTTIATFTKKHKIMFDPVMQTMKSIINFSTNNSGSTRIVTDDDLVDLVLASNPLYFTV